MSTKQKYWQRNDRCVSTSRPFIWLHLLVSSLSLFLIVVLVLSFLLLIHLLVGRSMRGVIDLKKMHGVLPFQVTLRWCNQ
mmetsp:Transcript_11193/g.14185  ORF Transcript_11193/g.14185 Transcript_11193/m.14185 type:complete len:80 (-) Transcript_11193:884-1123(-)